VTAPAPSRGPTRDDSPMPGEAVPATSIADQRRSQKRVRWALGSKCAIEGWEGRFDQELEGVGLDYGAAEAAVRDVIDQLLASDALAHVNKMPASVALDRLALAARATDAPNVPAMTIVSYMSQALIEALGALRSPYASDDGSEVALYKLGALLVLADHLERHLDEDRPFPERL
jgi:hypothetical protein